MVTRRGKTPGPMREVLLRNPTRRKILEHLEQKPGMNQRQLAHTLGLHVNAAQFHIKRLEKAGLLHTRQGESGMESLCFTQENVALWDDPATRVLFGRSRARSIALYLTEHPCAAVRDVAEELGVSVHTIRRHLRTLEECGLVERLRVDRHEVFHAEPSLLDWAAAIGHLPGRSSGESLGPTQ